MVIVANLCKRVLHQLVNGGLRAKIEELLLFVSKGPRIDEKEGLWYWLAEREMDSFLLG